MYSLNWKAEGESCLVIGAGHVALRKIRGLLEAGARVTVIAPEAEADIEKLSEEGKIRYWRKPYETGDEEGCRLVVSTCGIRSVAEVLHQLMKGKGFLYNAADFPELGNCAVPARLKRGDLTITKLNDFVMQITFTKDDGSKYQFIGRPEKMPLVKIKANGGQSL